MGINGNSRIAGASTMGNLVVRLFTPMPEPSGNATLLSNDTLPDSLASADAQSQIQTHDSHSFQGPSALEVKPSPPANRGEPDITTAPALTPERDRVGIPWLPQSRYLTSRELDVKPQVKERVTPAYPVSALTQKVTGKVAIEVFVNEEGNVDNVAVLGAEPAGIFDESAIAAWQAARFIPGMKGGYKVKSRIAFEVNFDLPSYFDPSTMHGIRMRY